MGSFLQNHNIHQAWITISIDGALQTGDVIDISNWNRVGFLATCNDSTGVTTFAPLSHATIGGAGTAMTLVTDYWEMENATSLVTDNVAWVHNNQAAAATVATTSGSASMIYFEFMADQFPAGSDFFSVDLTVETGGASIVAGHYILSEARYASTGAHTTVNPA